MADSERALIEAAAADHTDLVAFLKSGAGGPVPADKIIETHAAEIFLVGEHAYKIKKPVSLGYLDFSTLQKREWALERELERNVLSAPEIYLKVEDVRRSPERTLHFGGEGPLVDHVLVMRRFDDNALLSNNAGLVSGDFAEKLGRMVAGFHAKASIVPRAWPEGLKYSVESIAKQLSRFESIWGADDVRSLIANTEAVFESRCEDILARVKGDFIRQCHGDLHLNNIFLEDGKPVLFDCIEFDDRLSDIDVLYDLAFLIMDVLHAGQGAGANILLNGYLDQALRRFGENALAGLVLLPLYLSMRASIRAHVSAQMGRSDEGRVYLREGLEYLKKAGPSLLSVGGLSGTGKTTFARLRAPSLGALPGAVVLRSDEIRKRLWKVTPQDRLPQEAYTKEQSARVYETMFNEARKSLRAGSAVILDAVFFARDERDRCRCLAEEEGVAFQGFWLEAPPDILRERIGARVGDASDANLNVLEQQLNCDPGQIDWQRLDATAPFDP
jgi:aminoglycoside phosphotransferase family enzyme/predicted kinase